MKKKLYLRVQYETHLFPGDYSNGIFYDGFLNIEEEEEKKIREEFLTTGKMTMQPHKSGAFWDEPVFEEEKNFSIFPKTNYSYSWANKPV
jgi:hypothetical protein